MWIIGGNLVKKKIKMLTQEQTKQIKEQLLAQIESWPDEQREAAKQQLVTMSQEQFEEFLIKNKILKTKEEIISDHPTASQTPQQTQCIFCSIIRGQTRAYKIDENKKAIAILEINPISQGHVIIIPKEHTTIEKIPSQALTLAKKIAKKIKSKLKPKNIEILTSSIMGHTIINVLPIYKDETINSQRKKADEKELLKLQLKLEKKTKAPSEKIKINKKKLKELIKIPSRIP